MGSRQLPPGVMSPSEYGREAATRVLRAVTCEAPEVDSTAILSSRPGWRDAMQDETPGQCEPELRDDNTIKPRRRVLGHERGWRVPPPPKLAAIPGAWGGYTGKDPAWAWIAAIVGITWFGSFEITAGILFFM